MLDFRNQLARQVLEVPEMSCVENIRRVFIATWSIFFVLVLPLSPFFSFRLLSLAPIPFILDDARLALTQSRNRKWHILSGSFFTILLLGLVYIAVGQAS